MFTKIANILGSSNLNVLFIIKKAEENYESFLPLNILIV